MKKPILKSYIFTLLGITLCFAACKKDATKSKPNVGKPLVLDAIEQQKVVTDNAFSFKLFDNMAASNNTDSNLFISPLSVSFAMGMTSNGANGATLSAIRNAMDFNNFTQAQLNAYYNNLVTNLPELDPNTTLKIANSIWYRQGFDVLPAFLSTNSTNYKAEVQALDFTSPSAVSTINDWVSNQTNGKIPSIIATIPPLEVMYLINALYFKSTWKEKFDPAQTTSKPFYLADGSQVQTKFMQADNDINGYVDNNVTVMEMPYSNSRYSMVIVEPAQGKTVDDIRAGLDSVQWETWMSKLSPSRENIAVPKFTFSYGAKLNDALTDLGMGLAFSDTADFSLISTQDPLHITDVEQKAFIAVDESGTEAAAVTSVGVGVTVVAAPSQAYIINRPFIFAIREMSSGLILFTGIMNNPTLANTN